MPAHQLPGGQIEILASGKLNFYGGISFPSLFALALSGMFDGISVVIRETILRLLSPEHLRGRIAAVNWVFIGSSNEIGAFESGIAASLLGTVPAVWIGGVVTLLVVGVTAFFAPALRALHLDARQHLIEQNRVDPALLTDP